MATGYLDIGAVQRSESGSPAANTGYLDIGAVQRQEATGVTVTLGQATETDTAQAITRDKVLAIGQATETDTAQAVTRVKSLALSQAAETDTANSVTPVITSITVAVGQATETDTAQAVTVLGTIRVSIGQAEETDVADTITPRVEGASVGGGTARQRQRWRQAAEHVLLGRNHGRMSDRPEYLSFSAGADLQVKGHSLHASRETLAKFEAAAKFQVKATSRFELRGRGRVRAVDGGSSVKLRTESLRVRNGRPSPGFAGLQRPNLRLVSGVSEGVVKVSTRASKAVTGKVSVYGVQNPSEWDLAAMALELSRKRRLRKRA